MSSKWNTVQSELVHKNPYFTIRKDTVIRPDGTDGTYYVLDRPSCMMIVPVTPEKEIYLIHIDRYTTGASHWELPIGSSDNEDELYAAKRELQEETGLISDDWNKLGELEVANGMSGQLMHIYLANSVQHANNHSQEEEGIDKLQKFSFRQILEMIQNGEIIDSNALAAFLLTSIKLSLK